MLLRMYIVFDAKAGAYLQPFFERADGAAVRSFKNAVNSEKHAFFQASGDYSLWACGVFDDASGVVEPVSPPRLIVQAADLKDTGV